MSPLYARSGHEKNRGSLSGEAYSAHLVCRGPELEGKVCPLPEGVTTFGHLPADDGVLPGDRVIRQHARIVLFDGRATLEDLDGHGGTQVGEQPFESWPLADGDVFAIGHCHFTFRAGPPPPGAEKSETTVSRPVRPDGRSERAERRRRHTRSPAERLRTAGPLPTLGEDRQSTGRSPELPLELSGLLGAPGDPSAAMRAVGWSRSSSPARSRPGERSGRPPAWSERAEDRMIVAGARAVNAAPQHGARASLHPRAVALDASAAWQRERVRP
jgi:pSer/pThr/pTyr-binding forkhead associated (FHA) protein